MNVNALELTERIYRISVSLDESFCSNSFLLVDDKPMLIHTGWNEWFGDTSKVVGRLLSSKKLAYIAFSHVEADESGSVRKWLEMYPDAEVLVGTVGESTVGQLITKKPKVLKDSDRLSLGTMDIEFWETPHFPHNWDACLFFEKQTRTIFCSDFCANYGGFESVFTDDDITESIVSLQKDYQYMAPGSHLVEGAKRIVDSKPNILAIQHGYSLKGESIYKSINKVLEQL